MFTHTRAHPPTHTHTHRSTYMRNVVVHETHSNVVSRFVRLFRLATWVHWCDKHHYMHKFTRFFSLFPSLSFKFLVPSRWKIFCFHSKIERERELLDTVRRIRYYVVFSFVVVDDAFGGWALVLAMTIWCFAVRQRRWQCWTVRFGICRLLSLPPFRLFIMWNVPSSNGREWHSTTTWYAVDVVAQCRQPNVSVIFLSGP